MMYYITISPLVAHGSVTIDFDLYYKVGNSTGLHNDSYFKVNIDQQIIAIRAPDNLQTCDNDWRSDIAGYCNKRMYVV